jgi:hypothetical protein
MKINSIFLILLLALILSGCKRNSEPSQQAQAKLQELSFSRETLIETRPWQRPYFFPLNLNRAHYDFTNNPNGQKAMPERNIPYANELGTPSVDYFWALNSGELAFLNNHFGVIYVLDYQQGRYLTFCPKLDPNELLGYLWSGPRDEFYLGIDDVSGKKTNNLRIIKYAREGADFTQVGPYYPMSFINYSFGIRIAPDGDIYARGWGSCRETACQYGVFNDSGRFIDCTCAEGITVGGLRFYYNDYLPFQFDKKSLITLDKDSLIAKLIFSPKYPQYNFKATFNNLIVTYKHRFFTQTIDRGATFYADLPAVVVLNASTGHSIEINLKDNPNGDYKYFNVSDVSINYKGEIYALFVYFDSPGQITGDELIVLYRWRMKTNSEIIAEKDK